MGWARSKWRSLALSGFFVCCCFLLIRDLPARKWPFKTNPFFKVTRYTAELGPKGGVEWNSQPLIQFSVHKRRHWLTGCLYCNAQSTTIVTHLVRTQSLNVLPFKPGVGQYIAIHATLTARDFFLAYLDTSGPFTCIFSKNSPEIFPLFTVANTWFLCRPAE